MSRSMQCPACGRAHSVTPRAALSVCTGCGGAFDVRAADSPRYLFDAPSTPPQTPLRVGEAGVIRGERYVITGRVTFQEEGTYSWDTLQLFSPARGYAYLTCEYGHWTFWTPLKHGPDFNPRDTRRARTGKRLGYGGQRYRIYEIGTARVTGVEGELTWLARPNDKHDYLDAVRPPHMLSASWTPSYTDWSHGSHLPRVSVAKGFGRPVSEFPEASGVAPAQPFVRASSQRLARRIGLAGTAILLLLAAGAWCFRDAGSTVLLDEAVGPAYMTERGWISPAFDVPAGGHVCEVTTRATNLKNEWTALSMVFLDASDSAVMHAETVMEFYTGEPWHQSWTEGDPSDSVLIRLEGPAAYRVNVFGASGRWERTPLDAPDLRTWNEPTAKAHDVRMTIRADVHVARYYLLAALLVCWYPLWDFLRWGHFEAMRWSAKDDV